MDVVRQYKKPVRKAADDFVAPKLPGPVKAQEEYLLESLRLMPVVAGIGAVTHEAVLKGWAKHLVETGVVHREYLETLADDKGMIHVSQLPRRSKKYIPAARGPRHGFNNAARWVDVNSKETPIPVVQDPRMMTAQEREAQLGIYRELGLLPEQRPVHHTASVVR